MGKSAELFGALAGQPRTMVQELALKVYAQWTRKVAKHKSIQSTEKQIKAVAARGVRFFEDEGQRDGLTYLKSEDGLYDAAARWLVVKVMRQNRIYQGEHRPEDKVPHLATWMNQQRYDDEVLETGFKPMVSQPAGDTLAEILARRNQ